MSRREQWLRIALAELMEIDAAQISSNQPFSEQGVDSLIGLRLTRKLEDQLGVEVELEWLFDHPSIQALAQFLDERFGDIDADTTRVNRDCRSSA